MPPIELSRLPARPVTRFAPSPTGYLHLGHVANAVWTWGVALSTGGRVLLRIEDHDRGRSRPEYERAILDELEWLGLEPDPASRASLAGGSSSYRQSDNDTAYRAAVDRLAGIASVYACRCSRADIARRLASDGQERREELRYPGTCRSLGLAPVGGLGVRLALPDRTIEFSDVRLGSHRQTPAAQCGDLLLRDPEGSWTYQLAVAVDDLRHGVNLVIRGEDLLASTGRQILLAQMLGRDAPALFLHHPLIANEAGAKLSKRDRATGIRELRAAGRTPGEVLGEAAWRTGLLPERRAITVTELAGLIKRPSR